MPTPPPVDLRNPVAFQHPSLAPAEPNPHSRAAQKMRQQVPTEAQPLHTYEMHEMMGQQLLELAATELLVEKYGHFGVDALQVVRELVIGSDYLAEQALYYNLLDRVADDPVMRDTLAADRELCASLFRSYVGGIFSQHGRRYVRQWVRSCLRAVMHAHERQLRRAASDARRQGARASAPLRKLEALCRAHGVEPEWTEQVKGLPPNQLFRVEVAFLGVKAAGLGRTLQLAKASAVQHALGLKNQIVPQDDGIDWTSHLYRYLQKRRAPPPTFETYLDDYSYYACRLTALKETYVATGVSKRQARVHAARLAMRTLGVDPVDVPLEANPRNLRDRQRKKAWEARRAGSARVEEEGETDDGVERAREPAETGRRDP